MSISLEFHESGSVRVFLYDGPDRSISCTGQPSELADLLPPRVIDQIRGLCIGLADVLPQRLPDSRLIER